MSEQSDDASRPPFSVEAGVLKVNRELDDVDPEEFLAAMRQFVTSDVAAPVLDIGDKSFVPSYHIGGIRTVGDECVRNGRPLTVCARRNVKTLLERMGLGVILRLKVAD
jgi:hypothetical protein